MLTLCYSYNNKKIEITFYYQSIILYFTKIQLHYINLNKDKRIIPFIIIFKKKRNSLIDYDSLFRINMLVFLILNKLKDVSIISEKGRLLQIIGERNIIYTNNVFRRNNQLIIHNQLL